MVGTDRRAVRIRPSAFGLRTSTFRRVTLVSFLVPYLTKALKLFHRPVHRREKQAHAGLRFIAHVRNAERGSLDLPITAVDQKPLVLHQLLKFRHIHHAPAW